MLTIKVEAMLGEDIEKTFKDAIELSKKLRCHIHFNFNGVTCLAYPGGDPKIGVTNFHREIQKEDGYKIASC